MALQFLNTDILYNHHSIIKTLQKITLTIKHVHDYIVVKHIKFKAFYKKGKGNRNRSCHIFLHPSVGVTVPPEEDPNTCGLIGDGVFAEVIE